MYFVKLHTLLQLRHREFNHGGAFHLVTCCWIRRRSNITSFTNMSARVTSEEWWRRRRCWRLKYKYYCYCSQRQQFKTRVCRWRLCYDWTFLIRSRQLWWFLWCHCGSPRMSFAILLEETKNCGRSKTSCYQPRHPNRCSYTASLHWY